jgi:predicted nucleotidyltransferase
MSQMPELGGLPARTIEQIDGVLRLFPEIRWVKLYGSRAIGRHRPGSDIDLAFSAPHDCSAALAGALEELPTPYLVDLTHWESLRHEGLRRHIATVGLPWPHVPDTPETASTSGASSDRGWAPAAP